MTTSDKLVLMHEGRLSAKYGAAGLKSVKAALAALVTADRRRGLITTLVRLDHTDDMSAHGGVVDAEVSPRSVKRAVDRLYAGLQPHYLLLLGGPDLLPMVPLVNPVWGQEDGDPDRTVPSDLPYACEAPYATQADRFLGPTRVVGRLPDLMGARRPDLLTQLIRAAARSRPRPRDDFEQSFGLSAQAWDASTRLSLRNTFGPGTPMHSVPPDGPSWTKDQLAPRMHFINCHGDELSPDYFGQPPGQEVYPVALTSARLTGRVSAGTVIAAECCYGAQLFDPADAGGAWPMALAYLRDGASAFLGSSTVAYGPSEGNGSADLLCQFFLQQVLAGASTGRAALEARQRFAGERTHLDPLDLKTLAQFHLLGDPSSQPVAVPGHALTRTAAFRKAFAGTQDRTVRALRRERLERDGRWLATALPRLQASNAAPSAKVAEVLAAMARQSGLPSARLAHRCVELKPQRGRGASAESGPTSPRRLHLVQGRIGATTPSGPTQRVVILVATEEDGQLLHVRRLHAR